jgi:TRAP-type C4-dicarboxylate transport system substrate-binding protein
MFRLLLILFGIIAVTDLSAREYRLGLITPATHIWTKSAESFGAALHEATGGRHSLTVYPAQQLGNEAQILQQLQTGAVDMAFLTAAEVSNRVPDFGAFYAPYLVDDIAGAAQLLQSESALSLLEQLPRKIGVVGIAYGMGGMRQILTRQEAATAADLQGRKIRITPFAPIRDFYQLLGAAPTPMPLGSVYDALANGQVDAIDMDLELIVKLRYHELADTVLLSDHMMFPMVGLISARVWVRLDETEQELIRRLMSVELDRLVTAYVDEERQYLRQLETSDVRIVRIDREFFGDTVDEWDSIWARQAPVLNELRQIGQSITGKRPAR